MKFTVIGASGFVGSALTRSLLLKGHEVWAPDRSGTAIYEVPHGHVIYAAGVTADFRQRPFDTLRAHTTSLADFLEKSTFESFLYLSSARIYRNAASTTEDSLISVNPATSEDLYDLTKLTGEAMCHATSAKNVRIARPTNIIGQDFGSTNFLFDLIRSARETGTLMLKTSLSSSKDYVALDDVVEILIRISTSGEQNVYNIASGRNISHRDIVDILVHATGAHVEISSPAPVVTPPDINIDRIQREFAFQPKSIPPIVVNLISEYKRST